MERFVRTLKNEWGPVVDYRKRQGGSFFEREKHRDADKNDRFVRKRLFLQ